MSYIRTKTKKHLTPSSLSSGSGTSDEEKSAVDFKRGRKRQHHDSANGNGDTISDNSNSTNYAGMYLSTSNGSNNGSPKYNTKKMRIMGQVEKDNADNNSSGNDPDDTYTSEFKDLLPTPQSLETISNVGARLMSKMGYQAGMGLGKHGQGISAPVSVTMKEGKRGLGHIVKGMEPGTSNWKFEEEEIIIEEEINWIPPEACAPIDFKTLTSWRKVGPKKLSIHDETQFCDPEILKNIISLKSIFDELQERELFSARSKSNPFESIKNGIFINRAAMKMANIDAILGFALTEPKSESGKLVVGQSDLLYFADVCAGPGGFSEYVLWRKKWDAKGFGFTLKGECDFKLGDFFSGPPESFEPYYGPANDGDIYNPINVKSFVHYVRSSTDGRGVHFMMADGGFSVTGQENIQEILSRQLYLSQCLVAIGIVRSGGHFVCKMFDVFTPFSVGLIYLMYLSFDLVAICKPNTSRPANSERYIVCKWKRENSDSVYRYLVESHQSMWDWSRSPESERDLDILELVPLEILKKADHRFFKYIYESNNWNGKRQIQNLKKIIAFCRDQTLQETRQLEVRTKCLEFWKIPDEIRKNVQVESAPSRFREIRGPYGEGFVKDTEKELTAKFMETVFKSPYDWRFVVVEGAQNKKNRGFYLSLGRTKNFRYDGRDWQKVDIRFEVCKNTLVYGEVVYEIHGNKTHQHKVAAFHIIDGLILGGKDIRGFHYTQRHELCAKFAKSMNKNIQGLAPVRVKNPIRMENIADLIDRLTLQPVKGEGIGQKLVCPIDHTDETSPVLQPSGILFLKITRDPWLMALSRSVNRKYWFNTLNGESKFDVPESAIADFMFTMQNRVIWWWDKDTNLALPAPAEILSQSKTQRVDIKNLLHHIQSALRPTAV